MTFLAYFGHLNIDVTISVENIARKGSAAAKSLSRQFGGTLGNFAFIASGLGLDFHPYSAACSRSHSEFLQLLADRKVDISRIDVSTEGEGPVCYIISDQKDQNAYMFQGPMDGWRPDSSFTGDSYKYIHFSTGPPEAFLEIAGKGPASTVFDPSQELFYKYSKDSIRKFVQRSDIVMGNSQEIRAIFDAIGQSMDRIPEDFDVVMTEGEKGTTVMAEGERYAVRGRKAVSVYDTIGAGDAFRAGLYSALYRNFTLKESVAMGNITASLAIGGPIFSFSHTWDSVYEIFRNEKKLLLD